jgi:hypothetical protein
MIFFILYALSNVYSFSYIGCYKDTSDRDLKGFNFNSPNTTPKICSDICKLEGYKFAGLQYSSYCFCGNNYGKYGMANNCNMPCSGNKNEICGGSWANSIYAVDGHYNTANSGENFINPYAEDWFLRHWKIKRNTITNIPNSREKFGWKKPVRRIGDANPPAGAKGAALYMHPISTVVPAKLEGFYNVNSPNKALVLRIAGNKNGDFLLVVRINGKKKAEKIINGKKWHFVKVPLNSYTGQNISVDLLIKANNWFFEYAFIDEIKLVDLHKNNFKRNAVYKGCYRDNRNRDLKGFMITLPDMTPNKCINICKDKGFKYAGLQYSSYCFCGNSYGKYGQADNCNMKCNGNSNQICGGSWANSIYEIEISLRQVSHQSNMFRQPMFRGYRLDWCKSWGSFCGQGAADAFCKSKGFSKAESWEIDPDIGLRTPTYIIGSGQICSENFCDGFKYIKCR